jgi:cell division protein FtsB
MPNKNNSIIRPIEGLNSLVQTSPISQRQSRQQQKQLEKQDKDEDQIEETIEDENEGLINKENSEHIIDFRA